MAREGVFGEGIINEFVLDYASDGWTSGGLRPGDSHSGKYFSSPRDSPASAYLNSGDANFHDGEPVILDYNRCAACFAFIRVARCEC